MLRLLFQNIEQSLGPSLVQVSSLLYWGGLALLLLVALAPVWRVWMESLTVRTGMEQRWLMTCPNCKKRTIVTGHRCGICKEVLGIPMVVRLWTLFTRRGKGPLIRQLRWVSHLLGSLVFLLLSVWIVTATGVLAPQGALHRLFLGLALVALAVAGWSGGRALRIGHQGLLTRVGDAAMALAAIGVMAVMLFLADAARPIEEIVLARFETIDNAARIGERVLPLPQGEIGFDYLQLDQEALGYHRVIALGFSASERVPFHRNLLKQRITTHLRKHAAGYTARGLTVRVRTDRLQITPGQSFEVVEREGHVLMRSAGSR